MMSSLQILMQVASVKFQVTIPVALIHIPSSCGQIWGQNSHQLGILLKG